jgi:hypothetical protein
MEPCLKLSALKRSFNTGRLASNGLLITIEDEYTTKHVFREGKRAPAP